MKMVFQQKVQEKEAKLKQSEEELYARHREMKDALEKQRSELEEKKRRLESGRPLTPEKASVSISPKGLRDRNLTLCSVSSRQRRRASYAPKLEDCITFSHSLCFPLLLYPTLPSHSQTFELPTIVCYLLVSPCFPPLLPPLRHHLLRREYPACDRILFSFLSSVQSYDHDRTVE